MLRLQNYKKAYGTATVLQVSQLQLAPGIYWLKGENGAGKTTLLKSIAGIIPFDGEIEAAGIRLRRQRRLYTKSVSFAEAEPVFPPFLTGHELVQFFLQSKGGSPGDVIETARLLGIAPFLTGKVSTYSSGMLKKLSLLLCFTGCPRLILLDEPFITLDVKTVAVLRNLIAQQSAAGVSFLISSHQDLELPVTYRSLHVAQQTIQPEPHAASAQ